MVALGPKHARREDRCPLYRVLTFFSSDRPEIGLRGALDMGYKRDIFAFLNFGRGGGLFEGFRGGMSCFVVRFRCFHSIMMLG